MFRSNEFTEGSKKILRYLGIVILGIGLIYEIIILRTEYFISAKGGVGWIIIVLGVVFLVLAGEVRLIKK